MDEVSNRQRQGAVGVLLAGGLSRRMGGGDKGLLALGGQTMLAHVIGRLAPQVDRMVINANGDPARFAAYRLPVAPDTVEGFVGPLAGVLAGLRWTKPHAPATTHLATVPTDAPSRPLDPAAPRAPALAPPPNARIALAASGGELHPVIGLWPVALADDLEDALTRGVRKVLHWTDRHGSLAVDFPFLEIGGRRLDPFFNAHAPEELAEARQLIQTESSTP